MSRSLAALGLLAGLGLGVWSCGGSSGSGSAGSGAGACSAFYDAEVDYVKRCIGASPGEFVDKSRFELYCSKLVAAPGFGADLAACAKALQSASCDTNQLDSTASACMGSGTLSDGTPCGEDLQCKSDNCDGAGIHYSGSGSSYTVTRSCGTCTEPIALGQPCTMGDQCVKDAECASDASGNETCMARGDVGAPCDSMQGPSCKNNLRCDSTTSQCAPQSSQGGPCEWSGDCTGELLFCDNGSCQPKHDVGAPCSSSGNECKGGLACDASGTCQPQALAGAGEPCDGITVQCKVGLCPALFGPNTGSDVCPSIVPDGQPCDAQNPGQTCDELAYCMDGKCTLFDPASCH